MAGSRSWAAALLAAHALCVAVAKSCPQVTSTLSTATLGTNSVSAKFMTTGDDTDYALYWINDDGEEEFNGYVSLTTPLERTTFPGHSFRIYTHEEKEEDRTLIREYTMTRDVFQSISLEALPECEPVARQLEKEAARKERDRNGMIESIQMRADEFEALLHDESRLAEFPACGPEGQSHLWSCIRRVPADDCEARHQNDEKHAQGSSFGFDKVQSKWPVGSYEDRQYDWQMPKIPRLTDGPGFLKMNMTKAMRDSLLPWFKENWSKGAAQIESPVPGGYLNDQWVKSHHLDVTLAWKIRAEIMKDMQAVLEWWTRRKLRHTSTFGVRVYHRGNVLLNHVDRYDTHLASAIVQVYQDVDEDGGWPVEILSEDRDCYEVFLQPGEMLLYEGAHFKHGRPMSFRGTDFGNLFVHYKPLDWTGPSRRGSEL